MRRWKKKWLVLFVATVFIIVTGLPVSAEEQQGWSQEPTAAAMIADVVFVRPVGIVACAVGTVFFIVSLPFSALGGNTPEVFDKLMAEPAKFTFVRPLGLVD
jgi:hypothetical protein